MGQEDLKVSTAALRTASSECKSIASEVSEIGSDLNKAVAAAEEGLICSGTEAFQEAMKTLVGNIGTISSDLSQISAGLEGVATNVEIKEAQIKTF